MENQLEQKQKEIMENLQKEVDRQIKEQIADKVVEFIQNNNVNELVFCPFVEEDSMKAAKEEFIKLKSILDSTDCIGLCEQERDKYNTVKQRYEEFGEILNQDYL